MLELDHMFEISEGDARTLCGAGLTGLEELDFTFTPVTPKALLYFISKYTGKTYHAEVMFQPSDLLVF